MDQKYLAEIKAREQAATPGPWEDDIADIWLGDRHIAEVYSTSDTTFIAHARADIPALLAEVERQDQQIATLKKALDMACAELNLSDVEKVFAPDYFIRQAQEQEAEK